MTVPDELKESRREMLSKAWDEEVETPDTEEVEVKESEPKLEPELVKESAVEETAEKKESKPAERKLDETYKKEAKAAVELEKKPVAAAPATDRAPNSWKPEIREHWAKLPAEVRDEINRREQHIQRTISETAQVRKFASDFAQVVNPYAHIIRAQNSTPLHAVHNLMQTAAGLAQGNPQQKAAIVAEIMQNYGIDVQILDQILVKGGSPNPQQPRVEAPPPWAKPIFGFMENVQQMQQQRTQQLHMEAERAITALEGKPFFDDLREEMADLMDVAANRGREMTLEQAYDRAVALNPQIAKIIEQRGLAARNSNPVSQAASTLARARKAASTISGAPGGKATTTASGKQSRKEMLREAWDDQS
jgi:hypothetical protein